MLLCATLLSLALQADSLADTANQRPANSGLLAANFRFLTGLEFSHAQDGFSHGRVAASAQYELPTRLWTKPEGKYRFRVRGRFIVDLTAALEVKENQSCHRMTFPRGTPLFFLPASSPECGGGVEITADSVSTLSLQTDSITYETGRSWRGWGEIRLEARPARVSWYFAALLVAGLQTDPNGLPDLPHFRLVGGAVGDLSESGLELFELQILYGETRDFAQGSVQKDPDDTTRTLVPLTLTPVNRWHMRFMLRPYRDYYFRGFVQVGAGPDLAQVAVLKAIDLRKLVESIVK